MYPCAVTSYISDESLAHTQTLIWFQSVVGLRWWGCESETAGGGGELELQGTGIAIEESEVVSPGDTFLHLWDVNINSPCSYLVDSIHATNIC